MTHVATKTSVRPFHKLKGNLDIDRILDRIAAGETLASVARDHGATPPALLYHLRSIPDYQVAREIGMEMRLDEGLEQIRDAANMQADDVVTANLNLSRARIAEIHLRRTEWRAEREMAHRWGQRAHEINIQSAGPTAVQVVSYAGARTESRDDTMPRVTDVMSTTEQASEPTNGGVWRRGG